MEIDTRIKSEEASFNEESPELINMRECDCNFLFKDGNSLLIYMFLTKAIYNNKNLDMKF